MLFHKLKKISQALRKWSKTIFAHSKVQLHMALEVILRLDVAQELMPLSVEERDIRTRLKRKVVALAIMERARKRQNSRITNLKEGDANTRFFHLRVNHRRRKNFIHSLQTDTITATAHEDKASAIHNHFSNLLGNKENRGGTLNWDVLDMPMQQNEGLDNPFS